MTSSINSYKYSYANQIGSVLSQPLFKLVSNVMIAANAKPWETQAWRIAKLSFHCFIAAVFAIPAGLTWGLGKSITYLSKAQIDPEGLHLKPPKITLPNELDSDKLISIKFLCARLKQLNNVANHESKQENLERLCNWIINENAEIYPGEPATRALFCKEVSLYLKGIVKKIQVGEVSAEKERAILLELAEAATRCYPTWLEVSAKFFAEVNGQVETVQIKLLRMVQDYKENIILGFCQKEANAQWHALNFIRNILGVELGLNTDTNAFDPYAGREFSTLGKAFTKWLFVQMYGNVNRLISSVQTMINRKEYDSAYHDFLVAEVVQQGIASADDYVAEHFFNDQQQITEMGVNFLLRSIGVVK